MINSLSIRFYLNEHKAKGKKRPLYLRITANRKKAEVATIYQFELKEWDNSSQRTKKNTVINQDLSSMENDVYEIAKRLEKDKKPITAHAIKLFLTHKDQSDWNVLDFYDTVINRLESSGERKPDSIQRYRDTKKHLSEFLTKRKQETLLINSIDYKFISDFDLFLLKQKSYQDKTLGRNTVNKHHDHLKTVLIRAMKEGIILKNPYIDFKLQDTPSTRTYLTEEELKSIIEHDLSDNESLMKIRDIFIFSVYTGLRFEDAQQLTIDKVQKDKKGNYSLQIEQGKTKETLVVPLFKPAINILDKYKSSPERKVYKKVLPKISNQKFNSYLKVIGNLVGIKKELSHHVARHTCATTILLSNEVPIEVVSKWLGHTNIKTTQIYAKITNSYLTEMAKKIEGKI